MQYSYKFEVYKDKKKQWRWRLVAANGNIIGDSAEGYKNKTDCLDIANNISNHHLVHGSQIPVTVIVK